MARYFPFMWRATELLRTSDSAQSPRRRRLLLVDLGTGPEMARSLRALRQRWGVEVLVCMVTLGELVAMKSAPDIEQASSRAGIRLLWIPLPETGVPPSLDQVIRLARFASRTMRQFRASVGAYGAGVVSRCAILAASVLIVEGRDVRAAVSAVQAVRPDLLRTSEELAFLAALRARAVETSMLLGNE